MGRSKLEKSLIDAVSANHEITEYELELVQKYGDLGRIWDDLSADIKATGVMIDVPSGDNVYHKVNPAVTEKQRISSTMNAILRTLGIDAKGLSENSKTNKMGGGLSDRKRSRN